MRSLLAVALLVLAPALPEPSSELPLRRAVAGRTVTSKSDPAAVLEFDAGFQHVGGQRFILYDVADAEQHFFVDADSDGRIRRLFWVQFEGYLPSNTHSYNYRSPRRASIGGLEFVVDTWFRKTSGPSRPGSDGARARELLEAKGYRFPEEVASVRLVHLTDDSKRNELMIIYSEDLAPSGLSVDALQPGGSAENRAEELGNQLLSRATSGIQIKASR